MPISTSFVYITSASPLTGISSIIILFPPLTIYSVLVPVHGGGPFWMGDGSNDRRFRECH